MQEKEARVVERGDAVYHGAIDTIVDRAAEAVGGGFLALQFVLGVAVLADVVLHRGVGFGFEDGNGAADRIGRICVIGADIKEDKIAELFGI